MATGFLKTLLTPTVREQQQRFYGRTYPDLSTAADGDALGPEEIGFIQSRDSFYMATVNEDGWPYMQHRGGPKGFARVTHAGEIVFADYAGNRQLLSVGHLQTEDRVCLFLMDYPTRTRLKILGQAEVLVPADHPELAAKVIDPQMESVTERLIRIRVRSFDWNCPKYITPRFTEAEWNRQVMQSDTTTTPQHT